MTKFNYDPERLADDLYCIPVPLHDGSPVNVFVALGDDGIYLIDGGLDSEHCQATLRDGLSQLGFTVADIRGIVITHGHTDHVGVAPAVANNGGEIVSHRLEHTLGRQLAFDDAWLERHGLPGGTTPMRWGARATWPEPTRLVDDGDELAWGNLRLRVVWCPGHTPGLICLYEPGRGLLFTTDHVMRRARAPVSLRFESDTDPLANYLSSIEKLAVLSARTILPGHGRPFTGLSERLKHIQHEIERELQSLRLALAQASPMTAYELVPHSGLASTRHIAERYALSQVLARLRYLECRGEVDSAARNGTIAFSLERET